MYDIFCLIKLNFLRVNQMDEIQKLKRATYHLWTFVISKFISTFGNSVYTFGISLYVLGLTGSATSFALNMICSVLPRTIIAPIAGYIADKYSKKKLVIGSQFMAVLTVSGLLLYSTFMDLTLMAIYVTTALLSIASVFTGLTFSSSVRNLIDDARIQKAMALNQASVSVSTILGPVVGGIMFGFVSMKVFLLIHIVSYVIALLLESTMNFKLFTTKTEDTQPTEKMLVGIKKGFHYMRQRKVIWVIVCTALIINFFIVSLLVGLPYMVVELLKINSQHFGIIEGMMAVGMLVASIYFSIRKEFKYPLIVTKRGILLLSLTVIASIVPIFLSFQYAMTVAYYIFLTFTIGVLLTFTNTPIGVMMQKTVDEEYRGRIFGILETFAQAMMPLGMIVYGFLLDWIGPVWSILPSGICLILVTLYLMRPSIIKEAYPELYHNQVSLTEQA